jgi:hypothetical protein
MASVAGRRARRSRAQWQSLIKRRERYPLGIAAFCRAEGVSTASFYNWRRRLSRSVSQDKSVAVEAPLPEPTSTLRDLGALGGADGAGTSSWRSARAWCCACAAAEMLFPESRTPGGFDLADKELAVLLNEVAGKGAQVAVLLDSCHSGSGYRELDYLRLGAIRQTEARDQERPLVSHLDGYCQHLAAGH